MFIAEIRSKNGKLLFRSNAFLSRLEAANEAFNVRPRAKEAMTCRAGQDVYGNFVPTGNDIQWIKNEQAKRLAFIVRNDVKVPNDFRRCTYSRQLGNRWDTNVRKSALHDKRTYYVILANDTIACYHYAYEHVTRITYKPGTYYLYQRIFTLIGRPETEFYVTWIGYHSGIACVKGLTADGKNETLARVADVTWKN